METPENIKYKEMKMRATAGQRARTQLANRYHAEFAELYKAEWAKMGLEVRAPKTPGVVIDNAVARLEGVVEALERA